MIIPQIVAHLKKFEFNGIWITNPWMDETGRFPVDPVEYYGEHLDYGVNLEEGDTNDDLR